MKENSKSQWILAFDASCGQCRGLADKVKKFSGNRLGIIPLTHPNVVTWRKQALGEDAPYAPTLIRVDDADVRAWTGPAMAIRLASRLGFRGTYGLLAALGEARKEAERHDDAHSGAASGRRRFLRTAGLGIAVSVIAGRTSLAQAASDSPSPAEAWVEANKANLPQTYEAFSAHDLSHRQAIFTELSPKVRSNLWVTHVQRYRQSHPNMSAEQQEVIRTALELYRDVTTFAVLPTEETYDKLQSLNTAAIAAFGADEAHALLSNLGPQKPHIASDQSTLAAASDCGCSADLPNNCPSYQPCRRGAYSCSSSGMGCGPGWVWPCNGMCCARTTQGWICY
ncbi:bacteriocin fulvocin C-related protein [Planobispora longispora]|uniref:Uncharacterized protein n=1 Tax=Planobispora longispora TaxID=28887 RepID=A0A8J3RIR4_9ACTN|nr:bacteriocin fulvocin C-related protein [Planobispora longispora]GIH74592.1 hypothetical protein Plo01_10210 [Planobispora longispora]